MRNSLAIKRQQKMLIKKFVEFSDQPQLCESRVIEIDGDLPKIPTLEQSLKAKQVKELPHPRASGFRCYGRYDPLDTDDFSIGVKDGLAGRGFSPVKDFM